MKKFLPILSIISILFLCFAVPLKSQERRDRPGIQPGERREVQLREAFETRRRMEEIRRQTIQNDPELKNLQEQINSLQKQLNEKLEQKLQNNKEYQDLKQKLDEMEKQWRERVRERMQGGERGGPQQ